MMIEPMVREQGEVRWSSGINLTLGAFFRLTLF